MPLIYMLKAERKVTSDFLDFLIFRIRLSFAMFKERLMTFLFTGVF